MLTMWKEVKTVKKHHQPHGAVATSTVASDSHLYAEVSSWTGEPLGVTYAIPNSATFRIIAGAFYCSAIASHGLRPSEKCHYVNVCDCKSYLSFLQFLTISVNHHRSLVIIRVSCSYCTLPLLEPLVALVDERLPLPEPTFFCSPPTQQEHFFFLAWSRDEERLVFTPPGEKSWECTVGGLPSRLLALLSWLRRLRLLPLPVFGESCDPGVTARSVL